MPEFLLSCSAPCSQKEGGRSVKDRPPANAFKAVGRYPIVISETWTSLYSLPLSSFLVTGSPASVAVIDLPLLRTSWAFLYESPLPTRTQRVPSLSTSMTLCPAEVTPEQVAHSDLPVTVLVFSAFSATARLVN